MYLSPTLHLQKITPTNGPQMPHCESDFFDMKYDIIWQMKYDMRNKTNELW